MNRIKDKALRVSALCKGNERYAVLYDADSEAEALRTIGRWAANPELSLTWFDCVYMSRQIRDSSK